MFSVKYRLITVTFIAILIHSCSATPLNDQTGPTIENIMPSSKVLAKSDCVPTSLTISGEITDSSGVQSAILWYRVGQNQNFAPINMVHADRDQYTVNIKGSDIPGGEYGNLEFYIVASDKAGNQTKSSTDKSVQLLPCVG